MKGIEKILENAHPEDKSKKLIVSPDFEYRTGTKYYVKNHLFSKRSKYQQIDIADTESFGRALFLDNDINIAEKDAYIYNWNMVSPLLESKRNLEKVAILGGGDGGVLYETLKCGPKQVFLVDIDGEVVKASKKYLKCICKDAFSDPRAKVIIDDANKFLEENKGFSSAIYDLTTHPEVILKTSRKSFFEEIFSKVRNSLNKQGMVTLQCCSEFDEKTFEFVKKVLSKSFTDITFKRSFFPSFHESWIFASAKVK